MDETTLAERDARALASSIIRSEVVRRQVRQQDHVASVLLDVSLDEWIVTVEPAPTLARRRAAFRGTVHQAIAAIYEAPPEHIEMLQREGLLPDLRSRLREIGADQAVERFLREGGLLDDPIVLLRYLPRGSSEGQVEWALKVLRCLEFAGEPPF
jgi:hypothetical protein